ncbi:MAG: DUF4331 domain-containing protein [Chloroflexota bacterium]
MSSHREAPETSRDPVADNTDVYGFVSPDKPDTVTLIANFLPFEDPAGGPNFYNFGDDVLYEVHVHNSGGTTPDISYQFNFTTTLKNPNTFLYNTGPISSLTDANWNMRQTYSVTKMMASGQSTMLASGLASPPCNIGPRSTPNYAALAQAAIHTLPSGEVVFAGQRAEGFLVDIGSIFDLADLRPFQNLHLIPTPAAGGVDGLKGFNVHSIAIQVPKTHLTANGSNPTDATSSRSVIGVWASASRQKVSLRQIGPAPFQAPNTAPGSSPAPQGAGPFVQVSRLGNPLFNEVIVPLGKKDLWNSLTPATDAQFLANVQHPELAGLLPVLYPTAFPNLKGLTAARADLAAIFLTGIPSGIIPNFQNTTGTTPMEMLRLNMAIPPTASPNAMGLLGNDAAGFPNGRRVTDDVTTIELQAVAGVTYALVDKTYKPDGAASKVTDGVTAANSGISYLSSFPYLGVPNDGYDAHGVVG